MTVFQQHAVEPWVVCVHVLAGEPPAIAKRLLTRSGADDGGLVVCKNCQELLHGDDTAAEAAVPLLRFMCQDSVLERWALDNAS